MTTTVRPRPTTRDVPTGVALGLIGHAGRELVGTAVAAAGGSLRRWRVAQITLRPAHSVTVRFDTTVAWPRVGRRSETFVAHLGARLPDGTARVRRADGIELALWRYPDDPGLPALATALDHRRMAGLVADLYGSTISPDQLRLRVRAYRPCRRAVVEATFPGGRLFVKVVPSGQAGSLHARHRLLAAAVPVPDSLGYTDDGLVVLPAVAGHTLRDALAAPDEPLVAAGALVELLDCLPSSLGDRSARGPLTQLHHHVELLSAVLPSERRRLATLIAEVRNGLDDADPDAGGPLVPVHGDLYEAQLIVAGGRIAGLLDVDTAGAGHRVDDLANVVGHLSLLARVRPNCRRRAERLGAHWMAAFDRLVDPVALRCRAAAAVIGLATGPFRVQDRAWPAATRERLALADQWLVAARSAWAATPLS